MIIREVKFITNKKKSILSAEIVGLGQKSKRLYFETDHRWQSYICNDASPFLAALLLPCMKKGEDIEVQGEVSTKLLYSTNKIINLCVGWGIGFKRIDIHASLKKIDASGKRNVAEFFSGGVDSFYTYLSQKKESKGAINTLLFVRGFDIRLDDTFLYRRVAHVLRGIAKKENVSFIEIKTNLREFTDPLLEWDYAHGGAMASVSLALRQGLSTIYFSGGMEEGAIRPYGLHPDLDPLWSTEIMSVKHIGKYIRRIDKVKYISKFDIIQNSLRVCWRNTRSTYNCGQCEKCLRTMLSLYNANVLDKCKTFPRSIDLDVLCRLYMYNNQIRYFQENIEPLRRSRKNPKLLKVLEDSVARNKRNSVGKSFVVRVKHYASDFERKYFKGALFHALSRSGYL